MRRSVTLFVFASAILLASSALATTINITSVTGSWQGSNPAPGPGLTITNDSPTSTISWGDPAPPDEKQSSYVFTSAVPPPVSAVVPPGPSDWLKFGDFTHNNFPIYEPLLLSVDLRLALAMTVDGSAVSQSFVYHLTHEETYNFGDCKYGNPGDKPCPDRVTISPPTAGVFEIGGVLYTLELSFADTPGGPAINEFITQEENSNKANIFGRFTSDTSSIPEPASLVLLGTGLLGLVGLRKRVKK